MEPAFKLTFSTAIVYLPTLAFLKISICLFYLRLFADRKSRYLIIGTIIWILLFTIPCLFVWIFQCDPVRGAYDFSVHSKCISTDPIFYLSSVSEIVTDVWLISFITFKTWNINLQTKEKVVLLFILTLGWLSTVAAIVRVVRVTIVMNQDGADATCKRLSFSLYHWPFNDFCDAGIAYDVSIWSGVEVAGGLFCVSAPRTRPLITRYISGFLSPRTCTFTRNDDLYPASNSARTGRMTHIHKGSQTTGEALELHSTPDSNSRFPIPESSGSHRGFSIHTDSETVFWEESGQPGSESTENVLPIMKPEENSKRQST